MLICQSLDNYEVKRNLTKNSTSFSACRRHSSGDINDMVDLSIMAPNVSLNEQSKGFLLNPVTSWRQMRLKLVFDEESRCDVEFVDLKVIC